VVTLNVRWWSDHQPYRKENYTLQVLVSCFPRTLQFGWALSSAKIKIEFPLTTPCGYMISPHLIEEQDIEENRPGVFLKWPL
jgi:hypothetical protein